MYRLLLNLYYTFFFFRPITLLHPSGSEPAPTLSPFFHPTAKKAAAIWILAGDTGQENPMANNLTGVGGDPAKIGELPIVRRVQDGSHFLLCSSMCLLYDSSNTVGRTCA